MSADPLLEPLAVAVGQALINRGEKMSAAESCTGGWIAKTLTDIAGSSQWFERGFITYSNLAKREMLGVDKQLIVEYGAVSQAVVEAMASGALQHSRAQWAVAVSGIAGPSGGTVDKPVGTVWIAWGQKETIRSECFRFDGNREMVRYQTVVKALDRLKHELE